MLFRSLIFLLLFSFFIVPSSVLASGEKYINTHEKGWFWYEKPPPPLKKKKLEKVKKPALSVAQKKSVKPDPKKEDPWKLKPRTDVAMPLQLFFKNPGKNAKKYLLWLNNVSDRAEQMIASVQEELRKDPSIFPYTMPSVAYAATQLNRLQAAEADQILDKYKKNFGLIVFLRPNCGMCKIQIKPLNTLYKQGLDVLGITPDGLPVEGAEFPVQPDLGIAKSMDVQVVPSTFLVDIPKKTHRLIRAGVMALFEVQDAILTKLEQDGLWNPPERVEPWSKDDPRYKKLSRHGFNPFVVYDEMKKDLSNPAVARMNKQAAVDASERIMHKRRVIEE